MVVYKYNIIPFGSYMQINFIYFSKFASKWK
jgi:hypothetical protein